VAWKRVASCVVPEGLGWYADGYNSVSRRLLTRKYGKDIIEECEALARQSREADAVRPDDRAAPDAEGRTALVTGGVTDLDTMAATLRRNVPAGTPVAQARRFMEREGFRCSMKQNASFSEQGRVHEGIDYLDCDRGDRSFPGLQRWQVGLVVRGGAV